MRSGEHLAVSNFRVQLAAISVSYRIERDRHTRDLVHQCLQYGRLRILQVGLGL